MLRNYLKGTTGDAINTMMAAAGYNLRHWIIKWEDKKIFVLFCILEKWAMVVSLFTRRNRYLVLQPVHGNIEKWEFCKG